MTKPITTGKLSDPDYRKKLAERYSRMVSDWDDQVSPMLGRWEQIEALMKNEPPEPTDKPWPEAVYRHIPILFSKARTWLDNVCEAPTSVDPYFAAQVHGRYATRVKELESDVHLLLERARFPAMFRRQARSMGIYGRAIWRVRAEGDEEKEIKLEYIPPRRFWMASKDWSTLEGALAIGHSFDDYKKNIVEKAEKGEYYELKYEPKDNRESKATPRGLTDPIAPISEREDDKPITLHEGLVYEEIEEEEKWYRCVFDASSKELLGIYEYTYDEPWYFDQVLDIDDGRFFPDVSKFGSVQDIQLAYNELWNDNKDFSKMGALPVHFIQGWALPKQYQRPKPGSFVPVMHGGEVTAFQSTYNPGTTPLLMQSLETHADTAMSIGRQQQGAEQAGGDKTATAANIRQHGSDTSINADLSQISNCMTRMGKFIQMLYRVHYPEFVAMYGGALQVTPDLAFAPIPEDPQGRTILDLPIHWELFGKTAANTPMAQSEAIMNLSLGLSQLANPQVFQMLSMAGVDVVELIRGFVKNSMVMNRDALLKTDYSGIAQTNAPQPGVPMAPDVMGGAMQGPVGPDMPVDAGGPNNAVPPGSIPGL